MSTSLDPCDDQNAFSGFSYLIVSKRFLFLCLLLLLFLGLMKKSLDFTLGWVLQEVFANGTGCEVILENPQIHYSLPAISVDNVVIRHRSEPVTAGFRAKHISLRLHLAPLLHKEIQFSDLALDGARADSDGTQTGFIQTFVFLLKKLERCQNQTPDLCVG
jgi:hypothetical protein